MPLNNKHIKQYLFWLFILLFSQNLNAQNEVKIQSFLDSADVLKEKRPLDALEYGEKAKILAEKSDNIKLLAVAHQRIATIYRILGKLSKAEEHINLALTYPVNSYSDLIELYMAQGIILKQLCRFDDALKSFNNTIKIQKSQNDKAGEGRSYNNIGRIYEAMEQYDLALSYYQKAYQIYDKLPISKGTGLILTNIGHVYRANLKQDSALYYYNMALPIFQDIENPILIAYAYRSIASVTINESQSIKYLNLSVDILKQTGAFSELGEPYMKLGEIYFKNNEYQKAINYLTQTIESLPYFEHLDLKRDTYKMLYISYDSIGNYKQANYYQSLYHSLKDSVNSEKNLRALQKYESDIKLYETETQNKIQHLEIINTNEKLKTEKQQNINFLIGVIILSLLLMIVIFQVIKQKRNNTILNLQKTEIEKKDKEKEVLIREIHHRVKNNLQIISSLLKLDQRKTNNIEAKSILKKSTQRIESIAYIHEKLYQQNDLTNVDIEDYLFDIAESLLLSFDKLNLVELNIQANVMDLHADVAINLGMLTAELITNSIKHGFDENESNFKIDLILEQKSDFISFYYADNGGQLIDFNSMEKPKSFGMNLIKSIIKKLHSKPIINPNLSTGFNLMFNFKGHE